MLVQIKNLLQKNSGNFFLIAGPCVIEGEDITFDIAKKISTICNKLKIPFIFKGSYRNKSI